MGTMTNLVFVTSLELAKCNACLGDVDAARSLLEQIRQKQFASIRDYVRFLLAWAEVELSAKRCEDVFAIIYHANELAAKQGLRLDQRTADRLEHRALISCDKDVQKSPKSFVL